MTPADPPLHTAICSCGALSVRLAGEAARINACTCLDCQRRSGSAFSYTAFFAEAAVREIGGPQRVWREIREAGRWHDTAFCPNCGVGVYLRMEALPGQIGIPVGVLGEPDFAAPHKFYWVTRRPHWLPLPDNIERLERQ